MGLWLRLGNVMHWPKWSPPSDPIREHSGPCCVINLVGFYPSAVVKWAYRNLTPPPRRSIHSPSSPPAPVAPQIPPGRYAVLARLDAGVRERGMVQESTSQEASAGPRFPPWGLPEHNARTGISRLSDARRPRRRAAPRLGTFRYRRSFGHSAAAALVFGA
jgi:hypothetical protein